MSQNGKNRLVQVLQQENATTHNGATTHSTSLNKVVDMFFLAGASRTMSQKDIIAVFSAARAEDKTLAYKCLFWSRDIRGGAGERRFFQIILQMVKDDYPDDWRRLYQFIPEFGYWKDLFAHFEPNKDLSKFISAIIKTDGLLCKWMPRNGAWFNAVRRYLHLSPKELRGILVTGSRTVEQDMCAQRWNHINYSHVPSIAFNNYKKAFLRHDETRFQMFLESAVKGEVKVNAEAIFPYNLYQSFRKGDNIQSIIAQWNNLPDYAKDGSFLPVCDVSGSMMGLPMEISVSLGVYLSERNKGIFKDAFITFSGSPSMQYLKGNVVERFRQLLSADWGMNTNIQEVFELILQRALANKLTDDDLPDNIIIISDMEFDFCATGTNLSGIEKQYKDAGYTIPKVVFWNVNGRIGNVPASANKQNVALVSGASPAIMKSVLSGEDFTPRGIMLQALTAERYLKIEV